jgi:FKBP-type peptidyl-prolyl cis-trans isomerase
MKQLLLVAAAAVAFSACQVKYEKTKSGLLYKITKGSGGEKLKGGDFIKFNISYSMPDKDTVLNSTYGKIPGFTMVDTSERSKFSFMEVLPMCAVGDSITFNMSIDTLKKLGAIPDYDKTFTKGGQIHGTVKILGRFKSEAETTADYQKEVEIEKNREVAALEAYIAKKGEKAQKTKSGAFVVVEAAGDQTAKADSGKQVSVMYKGYLQSTGKVFDTNMDSSMHHTDPLTLNVGTGQVIKGWDEALPYLAKGGKGKIYIPAMLGYGPQGNQGIPPFSNLVFEVEIKDVKDAPAPPPAPAMPAPAAPHGH